MSSVMIKRLSQEEIGSEYSKELSIQDYSKKTTIEGVQLINLNMFYDDGGMLAEIARFNDNGFARCCRNSKSSRRPSRR